MKKWRATILAPALFSGAIFVTAANQTATAPRLRVATMETSRNSSSSPGSGPSYLASSASWVVQAGADSLVEKSKRAIIETGISEPYFDKHFKLLKTVNDPADRRVEWVYSVNEYKAQLVDAIGFQSTGGKRSYIHGIKNQLYSTRNIVKTLPLQRARRILRSCIGEYDGESVIYRTLTVPGKARLYLTARAVSEGERRPTGTEGEQKSRFRYVGFVDVETGKCVKKLGRASS